MKVHRVPADGAAPPPLPVLLDAGANAATGTAAAAVSDSMAAAYATATASGFSSPYGPAKPPCVEHDTTAQVSAILINEAICCKLAAQLLHPQQLLPTHHLDHDGVGTVSSCFEPLHVSTASDTARCKRKGSKTERQSSHGSI